MSTLLQRLSYAAAFISGLCLILVMGLMFVDVVGRYLANSPLTFAVELVELLMGLTIAFGLAITTLNRAHIRVDLVLHASPPPLRRALDFLSDIATGVFFALVAWKLFERAAQIVSDGVVTQILDLPVGPIVYLMGFAAALALGVAAIMLFLPNKTE